jgi:hypothetical protein
MADRSVVLGWPGSPAVPPWVGVRRSGWMLIRWHDGFEELYDLEHDPDELHNLAGDVRVEGLRRRLEKLLPPSLVPP